MKSFYDKLFSTEGDILKECSVVWSAFRSIIINGLYDFVCRLKKYMTMDVLREIIEEVADITASATKMGVIVDWMDEVFGQIALKRKHLDLLERTYSLEEKLLELDRQSDEIIQFLAEIDAELVYNNFSLEKGTNYPIWVLKERGLNFYILFFVIL